MTPEEMLAALPDIYRSLIHTPRMGHVYARGSVDKQDVPALLALLAFAGIYEFYGQYHHAERGTVLYYPYGPQGDATVYLSDLLALIGDEQP